MLATETAIFRNSYFQKTSLIGCYCALLKRLEPELLVFENIANHSARKTPNQGPLERIFNSSISWNLEFAILGFTRYKNLAHSARFPYNSLMRTKENQIYLL